MNKDQFIKRLKRNLKSMPTEEMNDVIFDYNEHFRSGMEEGRSEEEIAQSLGKPEMLAKQLKAEYMFDKAQNNASAGNILRAIIASLSLGFFNIVFILGPFMGIVGALIGLFAASIGIIVGGIVSFVAVLIAPLIPVLNQVVIGSAVGVAFIGIGLMCFGVLFFIGNCYLSKFLYKLTVKYLRLNLRLIKGKEEL